MEDLNKEPSLEQQIEAARNIGHLLESVGVDADIALHQGFVLVERFSTDSPAAADQLVVLQEAYLEAAQALYDQLEAQEEEAHHYQVDSPHR